MLNVSTASRPNKPLYQVVEDHILDLIETNKLVPGDLIPSEPQTEDVRIRKLSFRRGMVWSARFAPDASSIVYGATWEGEPLELFMTRLDTVDSRPLGLGSADVLPALSSDAERDQSSVGAELTGVGRSKA